MNLKTFPIFQDYCVVQLILLFKNIVQQNLYHFYTSSLLQTCLSHCVEEQRWSYQILVFNFLINILSLLALNAVFPHEFKNVSKIVAPMSHFPNKL